MALSPVVMLPMGQEETGQGQSERGRNLKRNEICSFLDLMPPAPAKVLHVKTSHHNILNPFRLDSGL